MKIPAYMKKINAVTIQFYKKNDLFALSQPKLDTPKTFHNKGIIQIAQ